MINRECEKCEYCKAITAQDGFTFYGCKHAPYKGKWIAEIEECPKSYPEEYGPFDLDNR